MDQHQMFLSNNIFDIDSALDRLEENLFTSSDGKSSSTAQATATAAAAAISHEKFEQPRIVSEQQQQDQQQCSELNEENEVNASKLRTLHVSAADKEVSSEESSDEDDENNVNIANIPVIPSSNESSPPLHDEMTTERTETVDLAATQAITLTSLSIDDKITTTLASSDSASDDTSSSSSSASEDEEFIPPESTATAPTTETTTNHHQHDEEATRPLISEESINNQQNEQQTTQEIVDDQPVTTDLTLTKTVELTENEPDPEDDPVVNVVVAAVPALAESQNENKQTAQIEEKHEPKIEIAAVNPMMMMMEEPREVEISQYNFESTMDDISDAELESLEQELEELVAAAEQIATSSEVKRPAEIIGDGPEKKEEEEKVKDELVVDEIRADDEEGKESEIVMESSNGEVQCEQEIAVPAAAAAEPTPIVETENIVDKMETTESDEKSAEVLAAADTEEKEAEIIEETPDQLNDPPSVQESVSEAHEATEPPTEGLSSSDDSASIRNIPSQSNDDFSINESNSTGSLTSAPDLGRVPPYWIPDSMTTLCMICEAKFNTFRRRHHCRACGLLLCSNCCSEKFNLHYLNGEMGRVCKPCHEQLTKLQQQQQNQPNEARRQPNPGNPMEYCSTIPPQQQVNPANPPLTIMVPTSVLKRGPRTSERKSVIFSDGIRPGTDFDPAESSPRSSPEKSNKVNIPKLNEKTQSFIPDKDHDLPPMLVKENDYRYVDNNLQLLQRLRQEEMRFAINNNFIVTVKIVTLTCCTNKTVINFSTFGLLAVRQDELLILIELNDDMTKLPKEILLHFNEIYLKAERDGMIIAEYGYSQASSNNFLGAFGGFVYIKPSFQCQQSLTLPDQPYLIGLLVHKWEVPWMKLFPLRLILRLGALYRYYPTPILSNINREPVYAEIGNTVMNLLADFRNFAYTIDIIKGLTIQMESRKTTVSIPKNRYDLVMRVINNSTDSLLALGADFSRQADGHLVCIQNVDAGSSESLSYSTQAIDIQGRDRITTGASLLILSGALKASSGLKAKCSIVEDGLMVQISATKMQNIRDSLKAMKNVEIPCGPIDDDKKEAGEVVSIEWTDDDFSFNSGVVSPIDSMPFEGKESIRMKIDFTTGDSNNTKIFRWGEIFVLEVDEASGNFSDDHLNFSKLAEPIARACGSALMPFLDLMAASQLKKIGIRVTLGENIKYLAGANGDVLAPSYMNALDNELIGVIHRQTANMGRVDVNLTLELFFYVLNK